MQASVCRVRSGRPGPSWMAGTLPPRSLEYSCLTLRLCRSPEPWNRQKKPARREDLPTSEGSMPSCNWLSLNP